MSKWRWHAAALLTVGLIPSCSLAAQSRAGNALANPAVIISTASAQIGLLSDLQVLSDGRLVGADRVLDELLIIDPGSGDVQIIGRSGAGPGEFDAPSAVGVFDDSIAVWDARNGRVQMFSVSGEYIRSFPVAIPDGTTPAWSHDGRLAAPTLGTAEGLVRVFNPVGEAVTLLGRPLAPPSATIDFRSALEDIRNERVPAFVKNQVRVDWDSEGRLWLVPDAVTEVRVFSESGELLRSHSFSVGVLDEQLREYFSEAREAASGGGVKPLRFYSDVEIVGDELWLLLSGSGEAQGTILKIDQETLRPTGEILVPLQGELGPFAVDFDQRKLFVQVADDASLLSFDID